MDITTLKINPKNKYPFKGSSHKWNRFKENVIRDMEFLEARPIKYDSSNDNLIISGNKRVKALIESGVTELDDKYVVDISHYSEEEKIRSEHVDNYHIGEYFKDFIDVESATSYDININMKKEFKAQFLKVGSTKIQITEEEVKEFLTAMQDWIDRNGSVSGFLAKMMQQ